MSSFGIRMAPAAALLTAVTLAGLAGPRLAAALAALPGDAGAFALQHEADLSDEALQRVIDARRDGLAIVDNADHRREIADALLALAGHMPPGAEREGRLDAAEAETRRALATAPADPFSWARLARIELLRETPDRAAAADALRGSMRAGAYDPNLTEWRLGMALALWPDLTTDDRRLYARHVPLLWRDDPQGLLRLSMEDRAFAVVSALLDDPAALDKLATMRRNRLINEARARGG